jgi:Domain of unknown function.
MKTAICCIAKLENNYIREWVEYHLQLGFSKIFIYDNNEPWGEIFDDILSDYIHAEKVQIIDCRGKTVYHLFAFNDCYNTYGNDYDWIAFFDVDEFLTFSENSNYKNIDDYLKDIKDFNLIHINWMSYGDNNIVQYNTNKILTRFLCPLDFEKKINYDFPENNHIKSIVKGRLGYFDYNTTHTPIGGNFKVCNGDGEALKENTQFCPYTFKTIYFRHFVTKTILEWIQKIKKGTSDGNYEYPINQFFLYNDKTQEKELIVNQYLNNLKVSENDLRFNPSNHIHTLEEKLFFFEKQTIFLDDQIKTIRSSKSYRLGKFLLKPLSSIRGIQKKQI